MHYVVNYCDLFFVLCVFHFTHCCLAKRELKYWGEGGGGGGVSYSVDFSLNFSLTKYLCAVAKFSNSGNIRVGDIMKRQIHFSHIHTSSSSSSSSSSYLYLPSGFFRVAYATTDISEHLPTQPQEYTHKRPDHNTGNYVPY